jgi:hypothetical protein
VVVAVAVAVAVAWVGGGVEAVAVAVAVPVVVAMAVRLMSAWYCMKGILYFLENMIFVISSAFCFTKLGGGKSISLYSTKKKWHMPTLLKNPRTKFGDVFGQ